MTEKKPQRGFGEFFKNKTLSDVIFKVEGKDFPCHKIILANASQYFYERFLGKLSFVKQQFN